MCGSGSRGWRWAVVVLLGGVLVLLACSGGGGDSGNPGELYPDRANQFREDQERRIGEPVRLSGYTTTVTDASDDGQGTVKVSVRIENRDQDPQSMFATDWTLVAGEHVYEAARSTLPTTGEVGDTPVTGDVFFDVDPPDAHGDLYIQYKPEALDAARGIWQLQVP